MSPWSEPVPVSTSARVRDLLAGAPDGPAPVLHRGPLAVYVEVSGRCVGLLAAGATAVPNGLRSRIAAFPPDADVSAYLGGGVLHIGGRPLPVGRIVDVHVPRLDLGRILCETADSATCSATPPAAVVEFVVSAAPDGIDGDAVGRLVGRGDGLTPLGDDVVCGWLAAHRALGVTTPAVDAAVRAARHRTSLLSATLLDCALAGETVPELAAWLRAVGGPAGRERLPEAGRALLAVGGSSGGGLMAGASLALTGLRAGRTVAA